MSSEISEMFGPRGRAKKTGAGGRLNSIEQSAPRRGRYYFLADYYLLFLVVL